VAPDPAYERGGSRRGEEGPFSEEAEGLTLTS
jgi:hypothetical protein